MGNICCCIRDGGRRRRSNVLPATETTPSQQLPPVNRSVFSAATPYSNLCPDSNPYPGYCPSPPEPYDHHRYYRYPPHIYDCQPLLPLPYVEYQKAVTIRNDVNLRKETLRLEPDPENPGRLLVAFTFDATVPGRITVVFFAKEGAEFHLTATKEDTLPPITYDFEKGGLGQKFIQPSGTGLDLSVFEDSELFKEANTDIFPLAVKMEAAPAVNSEEGKSVSANMQITQVTCVKEKGEIKTRVTKQILWVNATRYELQEIYGIGNTVDGRNEDASDSGIECVICLSEPRDTTVLPCRHLCLCSGCAKVLRFQTNLCPVCRQPGERLLGIQANGNSNGDELLAKQSTCVIAAFDL